MSRFASRHSGHWSRQDKNLLANARIWIAACSISLALAGCGDVGLGGFQPTYPPYVQFYGWDSLSAVACQGQVYNLGHAAADVRIQLFYATAMGESARVVSIGTVGDFSGAPFTALPQVTQGEPRFPRVGQTSWNGGSWPGEPRKPTLQFYIWCWSAPDSLQGRLINFGGWAYHIVLTVENRDGVRDFAPDQGQLRTSGEWYFRSAARESSGTLLLPKILKIRWEDYGGIRDSVVSPPIDTTAVRCY
jgi:hypothetical protein